jgi:two-component system sensor histidine kinase/response regulator
MPPSLLIIDDEPGIRQGCQRALSPQGYLVDIAANGDEGLALINTKPYDLVLLDVMMPGINGIDLIPIIHQKDADTVCVVITGFATVELAVSAIKQGAYDFLTKPFTTDELNLAVQQGLEHRLLSLETRRLQTIEAEAQQLAQEKSRLQELDKTKAAFIRLVTHELQAPVNAILTYLDLILQGYIEPGQQKQYLVRSEEKARQLLELVGDLLRYGRLKEINLTEQQEPVQVEIILERVIQQFTVQAEEKQITLTYSIDPDLKPVLSTPNQVESLWTNLLSNAIKYTSSGGKVEVQLRQEGANLVAVVKDTGIGFPKEAVTHLFSEFFRAKNAKAAQISGTGLGLAIVKQVVDKVGGEILVESEINHGSTFTVILPVLPQQ